MTRIYCKTSSQFFSIYTMIGRNFSSKNSFLQLCIRQYHQIHPVARDARLPYFRKVVKNYRPTQTAVKRSFGILASSCHYEIHCLKKNLSPCSIIMNELSNRLSSSFENNIKSSIINEAYKHIPSFDHLLSYIDVCVFSGNISHAQDILLYFVENKKYNYGKDVVILFNVILHGWANEGNWNRVTELLGKMETLLIKPNLQSFSAAIESIIRSSSDVNSIKEILTKIENRPDLSLENLFEECNFVSDQGEKILKGIRLVNPNFIPKNRDEHENVWNVYDTDLLKDLKSADTKHDYKQTGKNLLSLKDLQQLVNLQLEKECAIQIPVPSIMKPISDDYLKWRKIWDNYIETWQKSLSKAFQENVSKLDKNKSQLSLYPYLTVMKQETYVKILMQVMLKIIHEPTNNDLIFIQNHTGKKVMINYFLQKKKKNGVLDQIRVMHEKFVEYYCDHNISMKYTPREYWESLQKQFSFEGNSIPNEILWPTEVFQGISVFLLQILRKNVLINANLFSHASEEINLPAFNFVIKDKNPRVECSKVLKTLYMAAYGNEMIMIDSTDLPMLSPPLPWTSFYSGGFLTFQSSVIKLPINYGIKYQKQQENSNPHSLYGIFDALNILSGCRWKINEPLLDLAINIYSNGGNPDVGIPLHTPSEQKKGFQIEKALSKADNGEKSLYLQLSASEIAEENKSVQMQFGLSVGNMLRKNIIWEPHTADFRGRAFPCIIYFNHLGGGCGDVITSLFLFADGEELGEKGLELLKIHLVNLTDFQRNSSLKERLKYCDEMLEDIMDSADNPLTGKRWWTKSKKPWQTLSCCMELTKCLRSPEPVKYICHLPIHQDGSANMLQHYSALLRDECCAKMVNLVPYDKPVDIYTQISDMIEREREKDEAKNIKIANQLKGFISRGLAKQIVLTKLGGASHHGIIQAICAWLHNESNSFPVELQGEASTYLQKKATYVARDIFYSFGKLQKSYKNIVAIIMHGSQENVKWISPLGFPIIQPLSYKSEFQNMILDMIEKDSLDFEINSSEHESVVNVKQQQRAFFMNYIQCLQSSHMMLTALHCQRQGIELANINDCFWTLPSNAHAMNEIIRQQFVALHSQPLLKNLCKNLAENFTHHKNTNPIASKSQLQIIVNLLPRQGNFDIKKVLKSTYFFC